MYPCAKEETQLGTMGKPRVGITPVIQPQQPPPSMSCPWESRKQ